MIRVFPACLLFAVLAGVSGCGGARQTTVRPLIEPLQAHELGYSPQWAVRLDVPMGGAITHVTPLDDLILVIESPGNVVTALRVSDGAEAWRRQVADRTVVLHKPFRISDKLYLTSQAHLLVLDAATGQEIERFVLDGFVNHPPAQFGNMLVYGGSTGLTFAQRLDNGSPIWRTKMNARVAAAPLVVGTGALIVDEAGGYSLINTLDGRPLWTGKAFGPISAAPDLSNTHIFIASEDQSLYALMRLNGAESWKFVASRRLTFAPALFEDTLVLPVSGGETIGFDPASGNVLWRINRTIDPVVAQRGRLLAHTTRELLLIELDSGATVVSAPVARLQHVAATAAGVVLVSPEGRILHLQRR